MSARSDARVDTRSSACGWPSSRALSGFTPRARGGLGVKSLARRGAFSTRAWFLVLAAVECIAALFANTSGVAWNAWVRDLVPTRFCGRFFGARQRFVMGAVMVANLLRGRVGGVEAWRLLPGLWHLGCIGPARRGPVDGSPCPGARRGGRARGGTGDGPAGRRGLKRALGIDRAPGAACGSKVSRAAVFRSALSTARDPNRGTSPYFPYFYTKELGLPMRLVAIWSLLSNLGWSCPRVSGEGD